MVGSMGTFQTVSIQTKKLDLRKHAQLWRNGPYHHHDYHHTNSKSAHIMIHRNMGAHCACDIFTRLIHLHTLFGHPANTTWQAMVGSMGTFKSVCMQIKIRDLRKHAQLWRNGPYHHHDHHQTNSKSAHIMIHRNMCAHRACEMTIRIILFHSLIIHPANTTRQVW